MKKILMAAVAVLALGYLAASPWVTLKQMQTAAEARDVRALGRYIDFPALRASLKAQMRLILVRTTAESAGDGIEFGAEEQAFASTVLEQFIDRMITPEGLHVLAANASMNPGGSPFSMGTTASALQNATMAYSSLNRFIVRVQDAKGEEAELVLHRQGLGWRLADIRLPAAAEGS